MADDMPCVYHDVLYGTVPRLRSVAAILADALTPLQYDCGGIARLADLSHTGLLPKKITANNLRNDPSLARIVDLAASPGLSQVSADVARSQARGR